MMIPSRLDEEQEDERLQASHRLQVPNVHLSVNLALSSNDDDDDNDGDDDDDDGDGDDGDDDDTDLSSLVAKPS